MSRLARRAVSIALGASLWALTSASQAQESASRLESLGRDASGLLERVFGRNTRGADETGNGADGQDSSYRMAQASPAEMVLRVERLENQIRQLTGVIEQLQFRNQQLEQQLRQAQGEPGSRPAAPTSAAAAPAGPQAMPPPGPVLADPPPVITRRGDAFDPAQAPNSPGVPRPLGAMPGSASISTPPDEVGAPGGRQAGAPLDLATLTGQVAATPPPVGAAPPPAMGGLPPPPPRNPNATGAVPQQTVLAPSNTPRDEFDLAYGYMLRKDYALAEDSFRGFLKKHPNDRMAADATYWLGESLFQRHRYRDAAESFLNVSTKYEKSAKAPESLLRLGQSLAALKEREAACATLAEVGRKYPRASPSVRQGAERELKRAGC